MTSRTTWLSAVLALGLAGCGSVVVQAGPDDGGAASDAPRVDGSTSDREVVDVLPPVDVGRTCTTSADCAGGTQCLGGEGCAIPWTCQPALGRPCTADYAPFCGCDGQTFGASSTCPDRPYAHRGPCEMPPPPDAGPAGCTLADGSFCAVGAMCTLRGGCGGCYCASSGMLLCTGGCVDAGMPPPIACAPQDARGQGLCDGFFGYAWNGAMCVGLSGCSCVGGDCAALPFDRATCELAHMACPRPL